MIKVEYRCGVIEVGEGSFVVRTEAGHEIELRASQDTEREAGRILYRNAVMTVTIAVEGGEAVPHG